jgi:hypothetical protein
LIAAVNVGEFRVNESVVVEDENGLVVCCTHGELGCIFYFISKEVIVSSA